MFGPMTQGRDTRRIQQAEVQPTVADNVVWHYTNGPGLISILSHHVLWATSAPFLNDQQEVALGGELIIRRLLELGEAEGADEFFSTLAQKVRDGVAHGQGPSPAAFYILSASQAWDSLVMWRNYGGAQESYAIGIDADAPLRVLADRAIEPALFGATPGTRINVRRTRWEPVRYDEHEQLALVDAVFDGLPEELTRFRDRLGDLEMTSREDIPPEALAELNEARDDLEQALLLIKHAGFVDERETRQAIVMWTADDPAAKALEARLVRYRSTAYGMAPYLELTGAPEGARANEPVAREASPLPIRAVAISPSPNGDEATESLRGLLTSRGYSDVPVLRSSIPFRG